MAWKKRGNWGPQREENFKTLGEWSIGGQGGHSKATVNQVQSTGTYGLQLHLSKIEKDELGNDVVKLQRTSYISRDELNHLMAIIEQVIVTMDKAEAEKQEIIAKRALEPTSAQKRVSHVVAQTDALVNLSQSIQQGFSLMLSGQQQQNAQLEVMSSALLAALKPGRK
jgi:hypothetical protein